jgi:hypothetical protein
MSSAESLQDLSAWARLNDVDFLQTQVEDVPGKGLGLFTTWPSLKDTKQKQDRLGTLLEVPRHLILSAKAVDEYAKVDLNFRQLLESVRPQVRPIP